MPTLPANGFADSYFVAEVRRCLRDQVIFGNESPATDGSSGVIGLATSKPIRLQRAPIHRQGFLNLSGTFPDTAHGGLGATSYSPRPDPPVPDLPPTMGQVPVASDGGTGGTLAAGTYAVCYSLMGPAGQFTEWGLSPVSNQVALAAGHKLSVASISGFTSGVTQLAVYLLSFVAAGSSVGRLGTMTVTGGVAAATTFSAPPATPGVLPAYVVSDTGELFFATAPASGSISVQYQTARFSDQQIIDALYEGLDMLWPEIWNPTTDTTSILPSPTQWEYPLPAVFGDQRTVMLEVEVNPPSAFVIYRRLSAWRVVNDTAAPQLVFEKPPPAGGTVRISYAAPFSLLSQVPTLAQFLPVYYAVARLLADQEVMRSRADDLPALTSENAGSAPGTSTQAAAWWMQSMFAPALAKLNLGHPARKQVMYRAAERLGLSWPWTGAA